MLDVPESWPISPQSLESVDLTLRLLELLAGTREALGVSEVARDLGISKPRAHRHLRALVERGYARQDARSERYSIGVKVLALGEAVRDRFELVDAVRPVMGALREATGLAVTASALVENTVVVLDMLQGKTLIDFVVRPGARLDFHASAHGLIALAFGPPGLIEQVLSRPLSAWTARTLTDPDAIRAEVDKVRRRGWATAADAAQVGVNALAAPVFDFRGAWRGAVALVGATQFIPENPDQRQIDLITEAAAQASHALGGGASQA